MANAGALFTTKEAGTIREGDFILINGRPCKVSDVVDASTRRRQKWCRFIAHDIFNRNRHASADFSPRHICNVPRVNRRDFKLVRSFGQRSVVLVNKAGNVKVFQVANEDLLNRIRDRLEAEENTQDRYLAATVVSAMGEEQICAYKATGPIFPR